MVNDRDEINFHIYVLQSLKSLIQEQILSKMTLHETIWEKLFHELTTHKQFC